MRERIENLPIFTMMIGLSGSGKTTYAENQKNEDAKLGKETVVISSDIVRETLLGNRQDIEHNSFVFDICHQAVIENLRSGKNVILDATNLNSKRRVQALEKIKKAVPNALCEAKVIICEVKYCKKWNEARLYAVPNDVIDKQLRNFQLPFVGEGWDNIQLIPANGCVFNANALVHKQTHLMKIYDFDQNNPNHTLTLYNHCQKAREIAAHKIERSVGLAKFLRDYEYIFDAIELHDNGKMHEHTEDENGIWHYYNHGQIGAYRFLEYLLVEKNDLKFVTYAKPTIEVYDESYKIALLTNYHMLPFEWENNKKLEQKHRKLFGEDTYQILKFMHKCDIEAK